MSIKNKIENVTTSQDFMRLVNEDVPYLGGKGAYISNLAFFTDIENENGNIFTANISIPTHTFLRVEDVEKIDGEFTQSGFENWKTGWVEDKLSIRTSPTQSMPGILTSYLNVDPEDIEEYARKIKSDWNKTIPKLWRKKQCPDAELAILIMEMADTTNGGAGVAFSHEPVSGKKPRRDVHGHWSRNLEDTVAGKKSETLESLPHGVAAALKIAIEKCEKLMACPVDMEFAFGDSKEKHDQNYTLHILQVRPMVMDGEAYGVAMLDMIERDIITESEVDIKKLKLDTLIRRVETKEKPFYTGSPASVGVVTGNLGEDILIVKELTLENESLADGMKGIISSEGSDTCHSAIRARQLGIPCITGVQFRETDAGYEMLGRIKKYREPELAKHTMETIVTVKKNAEVTLDGTTGKLHLGKVDPIESEYSLAGRVLGNKLGLL